MSTDLKSHSKKKVILVTATQIDIGLRTIASQISGKYDCVYLNTNELVIDKASDVFSELLLFINDADYVLMTAVDFRFNQLSILADSVRSVIGKPVIMGGVHAMLYPNECINHCDALCIGEADGLIMNLLDNWDKRLDIRIPNFWYRDKNEIIKTQRLGLTSNLDDLPAPDFSFSKYNYATQKGLFQINNAKNHKYNHHQIGHSTTLVYTSDRGCPHSCNYCYNVNLKQIFGTKNYYRKKSIENIIKEIKKIIDREANAYRFINIMNDNMASRSVNELELFAELYSKEIGIPFYCMVSPMELTVNKLKSLINAGCIELNIGIQTNEKTNFELYNRKQTNEKIYQVSDMVSIYKDKVSVFYDFIINNPAESSTSLIETIALIRNLSLPCDIVSHHLCLGKNTVLYKDLLTKGIIPNDESKIIDSDFHDFEKYLSSYAKNESFVENILIEWMAGPHNKLYQGRLNRKFSDFLNSVFILEWKNGEAELCNLLNASNSLETIDFFLENLGFFSQRKDLIVKLKELLPIVEYSNFIKQKLFAEIYMK